MDSLDCLKTRRSVRRFTEEPVAPEMLDEILHAAMLAPSAKTSSPGISSSSKTPKPARK